MPACKCCGRTQPVHDMFSVAYAFPVAATRGAKFHGDVEYYCDPLCETNYNKLNWRFMPKKLTSFQERWLNYKRFYGRKYPSWTDEQMAERRGLHASTEKGKQRA